MSCRISETLFWWDQEVRQTRIYQYWSQDRSPWSRMFSSEIFPNQCPLWRGNWVCRDRIEVYRRGSCWWYNICWESWSQVCHQGIQEDHPLYLCRDISCRDRWIPEDEGCHGKTHAQWLLPRCRTWSLSSTRIWISLWIPRTAPSRYRERTTLARTRHGCHHHESSGYLQGTRKWK